MLKARLACGRDASPKQVNRHTMHKVRRQSRRRPVVMPTMDEAREGGLPQPSAVHSVIASCGAAYTMAKNWHCLILKMRCRDIHFFRPPAPSSHRPNVAGVVVAAEWKSQPNHGAEACMRLKMSAACRGACLLNIASPPANIGQPSGGVTPPAISCRARRVKILRSGGIRE